MNPLPPQVLRHLERSRASMRPAPFLKLKELVQGLALAGLLRGNTCVGDSVDGGMVYWPAARVFCYSIVADADEIRELDGAYIVNRVGADGEVDGSEIELDIESACARVRDYLGLGPDA